jgi:hypothetical protein
LVVAVHVPLWSQLLVHVPDIERPSLPTVPKNVPT